MGVMGVASLGWARQAAPTALARNAAVDGERAQRAAARAFALAPPTQAQPALSCTAIIISCPNNVSLHRDSPVFRWRETAL